MDELQAAKRVDELGADGANGVGDDEVRIGDARKYLVIGRAASHDHGFHLVDDGKVGQVLGNAFLIADHKQSHGLFLSFGTGILGSLAGSENVTEIAYDTSISITLDNTDPYEVSIVDFT